MPSVVGDSQISFKNCRRHLIAAIHTVGRELKSAILCSLLWSETDWNIIGTGK